MPANRLISTTLSGATSLLNYNSDGARLKQVVNGVVTTYTQDLAAPLPVVLQAKTGVTTTKYLYSLGTRPLAQNATAWEYLLPDALGSVRQIADANGNVTLAKSYEPYGSALTNIGTASSIFAYAGEQSDTSGLIYLRARYMQPRLGIFLARDPWSGNQMRPGSMNEWGYGDDNPVNRVDPSGQFSALALANTFGYGDGIYGVLQMLNQPARWNGASSTVHWGWMKLLLDAETGDTVVLRGAVPVYTSKTLGSFYCSEDWMATQWKYNSGKIVIKGAWERSASFSRGYPEDGYRPLAPTQFNIPGWREQGNYVLVSKRGLIPYRDGVGDGTQSDLPDVAMLSLGASATLGGGQGSYMVDKYGSVYLSGAGTIGPGVPGNFSYGEGYLFQGHLYSGGMHRNLWGEDDFRKALTGFSASASGSALKGTSYQFSFGRYVLVVYTVGYQGGLSLSIGLTTRVVPVPNFAWDELFFWPAPSQQEVAQQAIISAIKEPCAICTWGK